jgi:hypothetical protein
MIVNRENGKRKGTRIKGYMHTKKKRRKKKRNLTGEKQKRKKRKPSRQPYALFFVVATNSFHFFLYRK